MDRSAINSEFQPMLRAEPRSSEKSYDMTILVTAACVAVGAVVAICALASSGPVDPDTFVNMVAFP
jgi:rhamnose utilization protein RhaD (predicted bifunctional aldolase and dehydrogenase)